jgi:hypothetical protein
VYVCVCVYVCVVCVCVVCVCVCVCCVCTRQFTASGNAQRAQNTIHSYFETRFNHDLSGSEWSALVADADFQALAKRVSDVTVTLRRLAILVCSKT